MDQSKKRASPSSVAAPAAISRNDGKNRPDDKNKRRRVAGRTTRSAARIAAGAFQRQPCELLAQIANYCCGDRSTVVNLSLTCTSLRDVIDDPVLVPHLPWPEWTASDSICTIYSNDHTRMVQYQSRRRKLFVYDRRYGLLGIMRCSGTLSMWPIFSPDNSSLVFIDGDSVESTRGLKFCRLPTRHESRSTTYQGQAPTGNTHLRRRPKQKKRAGAELDLHHRLTGLRLGTGSVAFVDSATIAVATESGECRVYGVRRSMYSVRLDEKDRLPRMARRVRRLADLMRRRDSILAPLCVGRNRDILVRACGNVVQFVNTKTKECRRTRIVVGDDAAEARHATVDKNGILYILVACDRNYGIAAWRCCDAVSVRGLGRYAGNILQTKYGRDVRIHSFAPGTPHQEQSLSIHVEKR